MVTTQNLDMYYREVKRCLRGSSLYKRRILENMKNDAEAFLGEHPDATEQDIRQHFGEPQEFVREYEATMPQGERMRCGKLRRDILAAVIAALLVGVLLWTFGVASVAVDANKRTNGYATREMEQYTYMEAKQ